MSEQFIDKYEILGTVGKGSMGVVYKGKDPEIGRIVAIKTLKSMFLGEDSAGVEALKRFQQESRSAGKLQHPNIVTIYEAGKTSNGSPFIVMEHIDGESLEARIVGKRPMHPSAVVHFLAQIANAVDYAHRETVIHRDLKPSNIILDASNKPYLLDFGVAKLADTSLTPVGTVVGTPSYMSPEQIRGKELDGRTDVFSLAVVAYELFTGIRPFAGSDFTTVVGNIMNEEPHTFEELGVTLPGALEDALLRGLVKERDERFETAGEFVTELASALDLQIQDNGIVGGLDSDYLLPQPAFVPPEQEVQQEKEDVALLADAEKPEAVTSNGTVLPGVKQRHSESAPRAATSAENSSRADALKRIGLFLSVVGITLGAIYIGITASGERGVAEKPLMTEVVDENSAPATVAKERLVGEQVTPELRGLRELEEGLAQPNVSVETRMKVLSSIDSEYSSELTRQLVGLLDSEDYRLRVATLKVMRKPQFASKANVVKAVLSQLDDDEYVVRGFAAKLLENSDEARVRNALKRQLKREKNKVVRKIIASSLGR